MKLKSLSFVFIFFTYSFFSQGLLGSSINIKEIEVAPEAEESFKRDFLRKKIEKATKKISVISLENEQYKPWTCDLSSFDHPFFRRIIIQTRPHLSITLIYSVSFCEERELSSHSLLRIKTKGDIMMEKLISNVSFNRIIYDHLREIHKKLEHCGSDKPIIQHCHMEFNLLKANQDILAFIFRNIELDINTVDELIASYNRHAHRNLCETCGTPFHLKKCDACHRRSHCSTDCLESHSALCSDLCKQNKRESQIEKARGRAPYGNPFLCVFL